MQRPLANSLLTSESFFPPASQTEFRMWDPWYTKVFILQIIALLMHIKGLVSSGECLKWTGFFFFLNLQNKTQNKPTPEEPPCILELIFFIG